ncbi:type II toxin-antitoxin system RelE/ParE family toxin [Desulfoluna sp.]|uniref:type II toxin-antitoxin system RelE/ParE family toxin n=1 Tax=Desulfoluna sp. TaxID=2045199 RepID=UPI002615A371|nr:type II toxin-antitoxin system RelE/ParE family toxin [Desulfoluna sp.]
MKIIWSPLAIDKTSKIANYIAKEKHSAARKWVETIFSKVDLLKESPEVGRIVPEINKSVPPAAR